MSDELVGWLRQQLDEDERVIAAMEREEARVRTAPIFQGHPLGWLEGVDIFVSSKRWRAEVEAKRAILDLHAPQPTGYVDGKYVHGEAGQLQCGHCAEQCHSGSGLSCDMPDAPWPCPTVRLIAQPYAGREGWREEWAV